MLTHANLSANIAQSRLWFVAAREGQEKTLGVLPFFHVFAMTVVMGLSIEIGAEIILLPRFELDQVMKTIDGKKPTLFPAVPTIYTAVANHPDLSKYDVTSIRMCISGGAPLPVEVKQRFEHLTGATVTEGYGLTESSPVACCNPFTSENKPGSIGLPLPGTTIEIVSLEDRSKVLGVGERGEVTIRGPQVMKGYWNQPEETAATLVDGRLHTGDVGTIDADGYVYIVDRIKDLILAGGFNIYPRNVEEALYLHPAVAECVVAGVPDDYRGETVKAYIKLSAGHGHTTPEDFKAFLKDKLSPIEIPKHWEFRDELPKTMIGKLSRKALLDEEAARREAEARRAPGGRSAPLPLRPALPRRTHPHRCPAGRRHLQRTPVPALRQWGVVSHDGARRRGGAGGGDASDRRCALVRPPVGFDAPGGGLTLPRGGRSGGGGFVGLVEHGRETGVGAYQGRVGVDRAFDPHQVGGRRGGVGPDAGADAGQRGAARSGRLRGLRHVERQAVGGALIAGHTALFAPPPIAVSRSGRAPPRRRRARSAREASATPSITAR